MLQMFQLLVFVVYFISSVVGKYVLLSNDDSWVSSEIRALYKELKDNDIDVIMVAPTNQQSHYGGSFIIPDGNKLTENGNFDYVKKGDPAWGQDPDDENIWYFEGSPAACISFAFDYLLPKEYSNVTIDLVVGGPNQGPNLSPGFFTSSGTMGATTAGIYRGYPGISFSGSSLNNSFFKDNDGDEYDPANIYAKKAAQLVDLVLKNDPALPNLTGINVNFPEVGYLLEDETKCVDPIWKLTSLMNGGVFAPKVVYDKDSNTFSSYYAYHDKLETDCQKGDSACGLTSEYDVFWARNCTTSVSVFSVNYGAESTINDNVVSDISLIFENLNSKRVATNMKTDMEFSIL